LLRIKSLNDQLDAQNRLLADEKALLEQAVRERTTELDQLTIGLTAALERANRLADADTGAHIKRVCAYSELLARGLGMEAEICHKIGRFASLHDVGKVGIPDHILKKPGKLTPEEWVEMKRHTIYGFELLQIAGADVALCHHEKFDGSGYPYGLSGEAIPIEARIVALADVYDALLSKRVYKAAYPLEEAATIIRSGAGSHFDPDIVDVMVRNDEEVQEIRNSFRDGDSDAPTETVTMDRPPLHLRPE
jgi:putative two-component system response regulator